MLLYSVSDDYINYLLTIDRNVMFNKDRPYAGLLFELNDRHTMKQGSRSPR